MPETFPPELSVILDPYQEKGWHFRYAKSINVKYPNMMVLYFTIPHQAPRFQRFQREDPEIMKKISLFLLSIRSLAHEAYRPENVIKFFAASAGS